MKKTLFVIVCLFISGITLQSCTSKDEKINKEVSEILARENTSMNASVHDGVVTLTGTAKTEEEKYGIEGEVNAIVNVKSVVNNVVIEESPTPSE
jgi:osmotically-inducible protein OsmY